MGGGSHRLTTFERGTLMNPISISCGLLVALFAILLLYKIRKLKPQVAGYGSQRMCPSCGLITSRFKACCLESGQSLSGEGDSGRREVRNHEKYEICRESKSR